ncbi:MAG: prefoldin subunit [Oligoflexia bacterium]|nr:prefoldin subunit [Oligoflexia bacterium]
MKLLFHFGFLAALFLGVTSEALANDYPGTQTYLRRRSISACNYWMSIRDQNGMIAYACSGYPMSVDVPEHMDVEQVITRLENRVAELEARLAALEKKSP